MRGCGASFGTWAVPWSDEERDDSIEVLDWVAAQPWAHGRKVSLFGQSYDAVAALRTAAAKVRRCPGAKFHDPLLTRLLCAL